MGDGEGERLVDCVQGAVWVHMWGGCRGGDGMQGKIFADLPLGASCPDIFIAWGGGGVGGGALCAGWE